MDGGMLSINADMTKLPEAFKKFKGVSPLDLYRM